MAIRSDRDGAEPITTLAPYVPSRAGAANGSPSAVSILARSNQLHKRAEDTTAVTTLRHAETPCNQERIKSME